MTDLLRHSEGQNDFITISKSFADDLAGNWYSPAAVARMIEEARKEEREACAKICDRLESQLNNITCIVAEMRESMKDCVMVDAEKLIADLEAALVAKENKRSQPN